jgi:hypothetical protein
MRVPRPALPCRTSRRPRARVRRPQVGKMTWVAFQEYVSSMAADTQAVGVS